MRNGMGFNWNSLYPFPVYGSAGLYAPPVASLPPAPAYTFPVIEQPVVTPAPQPVSPWLAIGGGAIVGLLVGSLLS